jgi:hypothetical protein
MPMHIITEFGQPEKAPECNNDATGSSISLMPANFALEESIHVPKHG